MAYHYNIRLTHQCAPPAYTQTFDLLPPPEPEAEGEPEPEPELEPEPEPEECEEEPLPPGTASTWGPLHFDSGAQIWPNTLTGTTSRPPGTGAFRPASSYSYPPQTHHGQHLRQPTWAVPLPPHGAATAHVHGIGPVMAPFSPFTQPPRVGRSSLGGGHTLQRDVDQSQLLPPSGGNTNTTREGLARSSIARSGNASKRDWESVMDGANCTSPSISFCMS